MCENECTILGAKQKNNIAPYRTVYFNYGKLYM